MNPGFHKLHAYPFERLARLRAGVQPADLPPINLAVGEPKHPPPLFILEKIRETLADAGKYPPLRGIPALREAMAKVSTKATGVPTTPDQVIATPGGQAGLYAAVQAVLDPGGHAIVVAP